MARTVRLLLKSLCALLKICKSVGAAFSGGLFCGANVQEDVKRNIDPKTTSRDEKLTLILNICIYA